MQTLVVTMAGQSSRFLNAGISTPKWRIDLDGKTILRRSLESVASWSLNSHCETIFVCLKAHQAGPIVEKTCNEVGIQNFRILEVKETPAGQAFSAFMAIETCESDSSLAIWNVDTEIVPKALEDVKQAGNWLSLTRLQGDNWSFATVSDGLVTATAEKIRISEWASIGLYGFANKDEYQEALQASMHKSSNEQYIAPLYNYLIQRGSKVEPHFVDAKHVTPLGTPSEVISYCSSRGIEFPAELRNLPMQTKPI